MERKSTLEFHAETLSRISGWLSLGALPLLMAKCQELEATGFFLTREDEPGGWPARTFVHFVRQPDYERFQEIQEAMNPLADVFTHSEVLARFELAGGNWGEPTLKEPLACCEEGCQGIQIKDLLHDYRDEQRQYYLPTYPCNKCGRLHLPDGIGVFDRHSKRRVFLVDGRYEFKPSLQETGG